MKAPSFFWQFSSHLRFASPLVLNWANRTNSNNWLHPLHENTFPRARNFSKSFLLPMVKGTIEASPSGEVTQSSIDLQVPFYQILLFFPIVWWKL